jgi:Aspartyl protease
MGQDVKSPGTARDAKHTRFQVASAGRTAVLVESDTGKTWILETDAKAVRRWISVPKSSEQDGKASDNASPEPSKPRDSVQTLQPPLQMASQSALYTRVKLAKCISGYIAVRATIDGQPINMVIDTGSPGTYLDRKRTAPLGFKWRTVGDGGDIVANADSEQKICDVASIGLGDYQTGRVRVLHHDMSEVNTAIKSHGDFATFDGILGANVLDDCLAVIDYRTHDVYLMRRDVK